MNFLNNIEEIKNILEQGGYAFLSEEIFQLQLSGGTGGEVLISVCSKLIEIKYRYGEAYGAIESNAQELISYCRSIGLFPEWNGKIR